VVLRTEIHAALVFHPTSAFSVPSNQSCLGFESLFVANECFLTSIFDTDYYHHHVLGFALGVSSCASYVGYLLSPILSPIAANEINTAASFWLASLMMGLALLASIVICLMGVSILSVKSTRIAKSVQPVHDLEDTNPTTPLSTATLDDEASEDDHSKRQSTELEDGATEVENIMQTPNSNVNCAASYKREAPIPQDDNQEPYGSSIRCCLSRLHLCDFNTSFWLLSISCALFYGITTSFLSSASGLLLEQYLFVSPPASCVLQHPTECPSGTLAPDGETHQ
jgi:hypothetical protein